ncbi:hypothetical protein D9757_008634 [Collybiopsis confluens]|uniref:CNNM transmembrane domain-containing protein n=1 Tax=Collybiopsis confluens TaxID=2823264 RepID=A0A8H5H3Q0_9AGAR|nr:hypothetical protein D9757_008634 [Collybiopsis confluens]
MLDFSEIIPQSLFTRHGLYLGAKMAGFTKVVIYGLGIISWPVAKLLEFVLGPHHGIIYRRAELKELIAMHSSLATHGGDLKIDTVTIIGATLDLQEKVVRQAMTPIKDVFMLSIDSQLDYDLLRKICMTGHSRVPVYEEIEVPVHGQGVVDGRGRARTQLVKKILGILLVKQCVLLDPQMAIAASVKKVVKHSLTQRLRSRVMGDSSDSSDDESKEKASTNQKKSSRRRPKIKDIEEGSEDGEATLKSDGSPSRSLSKSNGHGLAGLDPAHFEITQSDKEPNTSNVNDGRSKGRSIHMPRAAAGMTSFSNLEQSLDTAISPLGIITLEDVLEELIGEEIYDEFDPQGAHGDPYVPPKVILPEQVKASNSVEPSNESHIHAKPTLKPLSLKGFNFLRSRSAPPSPRESISPGRGPSIPTASHDLEPALPLPRTKSHSNVEQWATASTPIEAEQEYPIRGPPSVIVEQHSSDSSSNSFPPDALFPIQSSLLELPSPKAVKISPGLPTILSPVAKVASAVPLGSRSASPAASLEAILLDRKRRIGTSGAVSPAIVLPSGTPTSSAVQSVSGPTGIRTTPSLKGARFKSTPLGGMDRAGTVPEMSDTAAEDHLTGTNDESRIPDGKDKEGPDKEDESAIGSSRFVI